MLQGLQLEVKPLSHELLAIALVKRAGILGFELADSVAKYMVSHFELCNHCLFARVNALNNYSLQLHRKVTIPLVKETSGLFVKCKQCKCDFIEKA